MTRIRGLMFLLCTTATAGFAAPAPPNNDEEPPANRAMTFYLKVAERIDYELLVPTTLDKVLDELLGQYGIPWTVNERAFVNAGQDKDVVKKTEIDKIDVLRQVPRRLILNLLLARIPAKNANGAAVYIVRSDCVEITTRKAFFDEFYPGREDAVPPPLVYALIPQKPLQNALGDLAVSTGANVVLDPRVRDEALEKVSAGFAAVPLDTAVQVLADEAGLRLVRLGNVYYVTSPKNARLLRKEDEESRLQMPKAKPDAANPAPNP